jgi:hypothetical protein
MTRSLRILIAIEWLLVLIGVPIAFLLEPTLPPELRAFLTNENERSFGLSEILQLLAMLLSLTLWVAGSIGTFLLWRYGRPLYLAAIITGVGITSFVGPSVVAPLASAFDEASQIVSGLVLGLLYFSPLRDRFRLRTKTPITT